jgi:hypothetical protein
MAQAKFNFWDMTPKFLSVAILVTVYLQTIFKTLRVNTCMTNLCIKFHTLSSKGSLVIANKPETKEKFHAAAIPAYHILQRITSTRLHIFLRSITMLHTRTLNQAAQVSCPSHTLVRPSCSFY